jgi:DNA/RNA-binding domain of Phe-tRNA-synthetase-like protein
VKSLLKRVQKGKPLPFINCVVAAFNYISLKYLVPCGGDDVSKIEGNLTLGLATGQEVFVPLGGGEPEHPEPGEVIYYDDATLNVMCRKWNWRNGDFTKITEDTKRIVINVDGVGPIPEEVIVSARDDLAEILQNECAASLMVDFLDSAKRIVSL